MKALRIGFGLLAAAIATPAALAAVFAGRWYFGLEGQGGQPWPDVQARIDTYALLSAPVAFFVTLAFGAPYVHRLAEIGRATLPRVAVTGALVGALPFLLFDGYIVGMNLLLLASEPYTREGLITAARWAALGSWCGIWSALSYWMVAIRRTR
ncbi:MAG: hypothetical protein FJW21_06180 [Acidimicrobiia bacterium]|nr:hypothetical protein [Acidimicrobiia bacterium]